MGHALLLLPSLSCLKQRHWHLPEAPLIHFLSSRQGWLAIFSGVQCPLLVRGRSLEEKEKGEAEVRPHSEEVRWEKRQNGCSPPTPPRTQSLWDQAE